MSLFKNLFGRKVPDDSYDYRYYERLRASGKSTQSYYTHTAKRDVQDLLEPQANNAQDSTTSDSVKPSPSEPIDSEDESYKIWSEGNKSESLPKDDSKVVPARPKISGMPELERPKVEPLQSTDKPKVPLQPDSKPNAPLKPIEPKKWSHIKPVIPTKDFVAFVIENSNETLAIKDSIEKIINQILSSKKDSIFLFIKTGNGSKSYVPMSYEDIIRENITSSLITDSDPCEHVDLAKALFYLRNISKVFTADTFSFKGKKYRLNSRSIICIGGSSFTTEGNARNIITSCIAELRDISKLKVFKYFCIKDSDSIKVAALGFPTIGHIISNYYE